MAATNTGGPAFPITADQHPNGISAEMGMTVRDYFAAKALQGLLSNPKLADDIRSRGGAFGGWIEKSAYGWADAMLAERDK
jgi:hypothetical protein